MRLSSIMAARIILATGMRRSEALALTWKRLDVRNGRIEIAEARDKRGGLKDTKTEAGSRVVAIDADTMRHLLKWKAEQARYFLRIGVKLREHGNAVKCAQDAAVLHHRRERGMCAGSWR